MFYRIKQFLWAAASNVGDDDIEFIDNYLNDNEKHLFYSQKISQQSHSIKVAKGVLEESLKEDLYDIILIKAALLHDIGKLDNDLNIFEKSIIIILNRIFPGLSKRIMSFSRINKYYNHPEIGAKYLNTESEYLRFLIINHHNYSLKGDEKLKILQVIDSKS